ncbi:MAG: hypothetical protein ACREBD_14230, partial [Blastocatellia bacterium]
SYLSETLLDGISHWGRSYRLSFPLHGLRISRCRGEIASPAASEGQESYLHESQAIKDLLVFVSIFAYKSHFGGAGRTYS